MLERWESVLTGLETDPVSLAHQLDWVAKYRARRRATASATAAASDDPRLAALDLQYHDLRPDPVAVRAGSAWSA